MGLYRRDTDIFLDLLPSVMNVFCACDDCRRLQNCAKTTTNSLFIPIFGLDMALDLRRDKF